MDRFLKFFHQMIHKEILYVYCDVYVGGKVGVAKSMMF